MTLNRIGGYILGFTCLVVFIVVMCFGKALSAIGAGIDRRCQWFVGAVCGF